MPLHHLSLYFPASQFDAVLSFYLAALAPLGYKELMRPAPQVVGLGVQRPDFWLHANEAGVSQQKVHVAFRAESKDLVHAFHTAALASGGVCNGLPGPRAEYTEDYYGAFVLDPVGNNIEACV